MSLIDVSKRPDRHKDLLDEAESFHKRALICFERGDPDNIHHGNDLALDIQSVQGGDIGWQIVDVGIILTKHDVYLKSDTRDHLKKILTDALPAWSDREFGRGNVNHPIIATWLYAAAGKVLEDSKFSQRADENLKRFIHIFSQVGDMSEYNSPTYLGPTLVGLANLGMYAELESTRIRSRLIEERLWLSLMARWHPTTQQLAGPHSRAYADSTLGFGGIVRYLVHAVLDSPVFWDSEMAQIYDHNHDAEWAGKIAACVFSLPGWAREIGERKTLPYIVYSSTDGEDYSIDGKEIYRGGGGSLTTYITEDYCLGSSERPYLDGGQQESCIAYWRRNSLVRTFHDIRSLYFRYVCNNRLPGQENVYFSWYEGEPKTYSQNLLHQDGRLHVLQHKGKAILLAQPLKRENGHLTSLRLDTLIPLYAPLDGIWLGESILKEFPVKSKWDKPILIQDQDIFIGLQPLEPTNLGGAEPAVEISQKNNHLILSIYNLQSDIPRSFPAHILDQTHNGIIMEIGSRSEYSSFQAFKNHFFGISVTEHSWMRDQRRICYRSGLDELRLVYSPETQEVISQKNNGVTNQDMHFECPNAVQGDDGHLTVGNVSLYMDNGIVGWLACGQENSWISAVLPSDHRSKIHLETLWGNISCNSFSAGQIRIRQENGLITEISTLSHHGPILFQGFEQIDEVRYNGKIRPLSSAKKDGIRDLI